MTSPFFPPFVLVIVLFMIYEPTHSFISPLRSKRIIPLYESHLKILSSYDEEYIKRIKNAKATGKTHAVAEFERAQMLKTTGMQQERETLRNAIKNVTETSDEVVLGILAGSTSRAISCLQNWISSLSLPRGVVRCFDENGQEIEIDQLKNQSVYLKYNSTDNGDCYMKPYSGEYVGVIFQPKLPDNEFRQFGNFPLSTF